MAMDTPATIAILGAGPIGLEAALYARYLGYDVAVYERDQVAAHVGRWGHVPMGSPFAELRTSLGLAALRAQDPDYQPPAPDKLLTGQQWISAYLEPLSKSDLLADHLQCGTTVLGVARNDSLRSRSASQQGDGGQQGDTELQEDEDGEFHLLLRGRDEAETMARADVVIDTTGVFGQPLGCGPGGTLAVGERALRDRIEYGVPDVLGAEETTYADQRVLVIGSGLVAAGTVVALSSLRNRAPNTRVTWITQAYGQSASQPIASPRAELPATVHQLVQQANQLAEPGRDGWTPQRDVVVERIEFDEAAQVFHVWTDENPEPSSFDRIVANVGYRADTTLFEELQVTVDPRTGGPRGVAARLEHPQTIPSEPTERSAWITTSQPHFYILGAKSYGRDPNFCMSVGFAQIRDTFALIGDRAGLDLYATLPAD